MRILFFNSSLEPGRDGVGDYVRVLAGACAQLGHSCAIAALHDPFVETPLDSLDGAILQTRLPSVLDWRERQERVRALRERFRPDWISFHLVPYAFQKKGILLGLVPGLRSMTAGLPLHLMFHELWLGAGRPSPLRFYLMGRLQLFGLRRLVAALKPRLITVSNPVHAAMLRGLGLQPRILPLFGNVPIAENGALPLEKLLPGTGLTEENRAEWMLGVFFGSLHPQWKPEPFFGRLLRAADRAGKRVCLVLVGRAGGAGEAIWRRLQADYGAKIAFLYLGEQPARVISGLLQRGDFGVATSPWQLISKSGTVAAMLDHGLPVVVTRDDFEPFSGTDHPPTLDPLVHRCDEFLEAHLAAGFPKRPPRARAPEIAARLLEILSAS
jgi:glycosyltransferase involved in cell wall biosynthesis